MSSPTQQPDSQQPGRTSQRAIACAALIVAVATVVASPWRLRDPDALVRLSIGRTIAAMAEVPRTDPLTFTRPNARWSNPEWLGDLTLYAVFSLWGEPGLQALKLALLVLAWVLVLALAVRQRASPVVATLLVLLLLIGSESRLVVRNAIHAYWLVPAYGLILLAAVRGDHHRRWLVALLPLGILWANLHASFPIGWLVIGATLAQAIAAGQRALILPLTAVLLVHPLLGMASPHGVHNYGQVIDHLVGADIYRSTIIEWQAPNQVGWLEHLPLHFFGLVGTLSFLPKQNRKQLGGFLLLAAGLALAYASRRFVPLMGALAIPPVAANLSRALGELHRPRGRVILAGSSLAVAAVFAVHAWAVRSAHRPGDLLRRPEAPVAAAAFIGQHAPAGSRLFNPFNAGPWLLWSVARCQPGCDGGARVRLYIDPRNNLGAEALQRYRAILAKPSRFDAEARRLSIGLALLDLTDGWFTGLNRELDRSDDWRLVFVDGRRALYARRMAANRALLDRHGYRLLRARGGFEHLIGTLGGAASTAASQPATRPVARLERDLAQLREQSPPLASVLVAYRALVTSGGPPPRLGRPSSASSAGARRARRLLQRALPQLPPTAPRLVYLATAMARQGDRRGCEEVLGQAEALFEDSVMTRALRLELARIKGDKRGFEKRLADLRRRVPKHVLWKILNITKR